jgi:hypothetical protein
LRRKNVRRARRARREMVAPTAMPIFASLVRGWGGEGEEVDAADIEVDWVVVSEGFEVVAFVVEDEGDLVELTNDDIARAVDAVTVVDVICVVKSTSPVNAVVLGLDTVDRVLGGATGVRIMVKLCHTDKLGVQIGDIGVCGSVTIMSSLGVPEFPTTPDTIVIVPTWQSLGLDG